MFILLSVLFFVTTIAALWMGLRLVSGRNPPPRPSHLSGLLNDPFTAGYYRSVLSRLELSPGLSVLDAGCGPGLMTVPMREHERLAALREVHAGLKPGGYLSVAEVRPDPDCQPRERVKALAREAGFRVRHEFGHGFMFTADVERPSTPDVAFRP